MVSLGCDRCLRTGAGHAAAPEGRRPVTRLQKYVFGRYVQYLQRFQAALENEFPTAFRLYRVFSVGVKDFARDVKSFALLARKVWCDIGLCRLNVYP